MTAEGYSPQLFFYVSRAVRMGSGHDSEMTSAVRSSPNCSSLLWHSLRPVTTRYCTEVWKEISSRRAR